jgi:hypothetical protein
VEASSPDKGFSRILWSAAPVKKNEVKANNIYTAMMTHSSPMIKANVSFLINPVNLWVEAVSFFGSLFDFFLAM